MQKQIITIINKLGLHARASAKLASLAGSFECDIKILKDKQESDAKSIMQLMMLAASKGSEIVLICEGSDEKSALQAICHLINNRFDEDE